MRLCLLVGLLAAICSAATTVYVDNVHGDDASGNGTVNFPYQTIQRGLDDRPDILSIQPNAGIDTPYNGAGNIDLQYDLANQSLTIQSSTPGTSFCVNMQYAGRFIEVYNEDVELIDRSTTLFIVDAVFRNGDIDAHSDDLVSSSNKGGTILARNVSVSVTNSVFRASSAQYGGAIALVATFAENGVSPKFRLTLTNCTLSYCHAEYGAAVFVSGSDIVRRNAAITSTATTYANNDADNDGGAVYLTGQACGKFTDNTFTSNTAWGSGGAVYVTGFSYTEHTNSVYNENEARTGSGGAIGVDGHGAATVYGSTFCSNFALLNGSALFAPVPMHGVFDKPVNRFQCNMDGSRSGIDACVGPTCVDYVFRGGNEIMEYVTDDYSCSLCLPASKKKRSGPAITKPCILQSTGTDAVGCGQGANPPCATFAYAYLTELCDEIRVIPGDTLTGSGNREITIATHVHMVCNGTKANCDGLENRVLFDAGGVGNIFNVLASATGSEADFNWWIANTNALNTNVSGIDSGGVDFEGSATSFVMTPLFRPYRCENVTGIRGGCLHYAYYDTVDTPMYLDRCINCFARDEGGILWMIEIDDTGSISDPVCNRQTMRNRNWFACNMSIGAATNGRGAAYYVGRIRSTSFSFRYSAHFAPQVYGTSTNTTIAANMGYTIYLEDWPGLGGLAGVGVDAAAMDMAIYGAVSGSPGRQQTIPMGLYEGWVSTAGHLCFLSRRNSVWRTDGYRADIPCVDTCVGSNLTCYFGNIGFTIADGLCYGDNAIGCASKTTLAFALGQTTTADNAIFRNSRLFVTNNIRSSSGGDTTIKFDECCNENLQPFLAAFEPVRCFICDAQLSDILGNVQQPKPVDVDSDGFHEMFAPYNPPFTSYGMCATSIWLLVDANTQNTSALNLALKSKFIEQYLEQPVTVRYSTFRSDGLVDTESGFLPMDFVRDFDNTTLERDFARKSHYLMVDFLDYQGLNTTSPWATVIQNAYNQHEQFHAVPTFVFMIVATGDSSSAAATAAARNAWTANGITQFYGLLINTTATAANATGHMNNLFGSSWTTAPNATQQGIVEGITTIMGSRFCNTSDATLGCGTTPVNENQYLLGTNCNVTVSRCARMRYNCTSSSCVLHTYNDDSGTRNPSWTNSPWWGTDTERCLGMWDNGIALGYDHDMGVGQVSTLNDGGDVGCYAPSSDFPVCGISIHADRVQELSFVYGTGLNTLISYDVSLIDKYCRWSPNLLYPGNSTASIYFMQWYWNQTSYTYNQVCAPSYDICGKGQWQHQNCRYNYVENFTCTYLPVNEGGSCYLGECMDNAGTCVNGFCIGGVANHTKCREAGVFLDGFSGIGYSQRPPCSNWTCDPTHPRADMRGCVFNGNYTNGTPCGGLGTCVLNSTCLNGLCYTNTTNVTVCNDGNANTTDTCTPLVSGYSTGCLNCLPTYTSCNDSQTWTLVDYDNGYGFCYGDPDTSSAFSTFFATVPGCTGPITNVSCLQPSSHLCIRVQALSTPRYGSSPSTLSGEPLLSRGWEDRCNTDVCNSNKWGSCARDIVNSGPPFFTTTITRSYCTTCSGPLLPACTSPLRSCLKLFGIAIQHNNDVVLMKALLDGLKEQLNIYLRDTFTAVSITVFLDYAYPHCNYIVMAQSSIDDSMQKLLSCISEITEFFPSGGLGALINDGLGKNAIPATSTLYHPLGVYSSSYTKPDVVLVIVTVQSVTHSFSTNTLDLVSQLTAANCTLYGIYAGFKTWTQIRSNTPTNMNAVFGALDTKWWISGLPMGDADGIGPAVQGNFTVALRKFFNATVPVSCPGHSPPCTTATLNTTSCTCSVATNVSMNGQVCGPLVRDFPLCVQNATCNLGACNPASGVPQQVYCRDELLCSTDTCDYTHAQADSLGCFHNRSIGCNTEFWSDVIPNGDCAIVRKNCQPRPEYECAASPIVKLPPLDGWVGGDVFSTDGRIPGFCFFSEFSFNDGGNFALPTRGTPLSSQAIPTGLWINAAPYSSYYSQSMANLHPNHTLCYDNTPLDCYDKRCNCMNFTCETFQRPTGAPCGPVVSFTANSVCASNASCVAGPPTVFTTGTGVCLECFGSYYAPWQTSADVAGCSNFNQTLVNAHAAACFTQFPQQDADCVQTVLCAKTNIIFNSATTVDTWANVTTLTYMSGNQTIECHFIARSIGAACCSNDNTRTSLLLGGNNPTRCTSYGVCQPVVDPVVNCDDSNPCTFDRPCNGVCVNSPITDGRFGATSGTIMGSVQPVLLNPLLPFCAYGQEESTTSGSARNLYFYNAGEYFQSPVGDTTINSGAWWQRLELDPSQLNSVLVEWVIDVRNLNQISGLTFVFGWRTSRTGTPQFEVCQQLPNLTPLSTSINCTTRAPTVPVTVTYNTTTNGTQYVNSTTLQFPPAQYRIPAVNLTKSTIWVGFQVYARSNVTFYSTTQYPLIYLDFLPCNTSGNCSLANACYNGACAMEVEKSCDDSNPCTIDSCNTATDACVNTPVTVGTPCDTGDGCNVNQFCNATGQCGSGQSVCGSKPAVVCGYYQCGMVGLNATNASIAITDVWQYVGAGFGTATNYYVDPYSKNHNTVSFAGEGFPLILGRDIDTTYGDYDYRFIILNSTFDTTPAFSLDTNNDGHWFVQGNPYDSDAVGDTLHKELVTASITPWVIWPEATVLMLGNHTTHPSVTGDNYFDRPGAIEIVQARNVTNATVHDGYYHVRQKIVFPFTVNKGTRGFFGFSVGMSGNGSIVVASAPGYLSNTGAVWVYWYNATSTIWQPTGSGGPLTFTGNATAGSAGLQFGISVHVSLDGQWVAVGAPGDSNNTGAVWIFNGTNDGSAWTQYGSKIVGTGGLGSPSCIGRSVQLSNDGSVLTFGGACETTLGSVVGGANVTNYSGQTAGNVTTRGSVWVFNRVGGTYTQQQVIASPNSVGNFGRDVAMDGDGQTLIVTDMYPYVATITSGFNVNYPPGIQGGAWMYFRENTSYSFAQIDIAPLASALSFSATQLANFTWDYIIEADISNNGRFFALVTSLPRYIARGQQYPTFEFVFSRNLDVVACNEVFQAGSCDYGSNATCAYGNCTAFDVCTMVVNASVCVDMSCLPCSTFECSPFSMGANATTGCYYNLFPALTACGNCSDDNITCTTQQCNSTGSCITTPIDSLCDDSNSCTVDTCNVTVGCVYTPTNGTGGACVTNSSCDDSNSCTTDICCGGFCFYSNNTGDWNHMCQVVGFNETNPSCPDCANCTINGICNWWENAATCPADCNNCNNNTVCDPNEGEQCVDCRTTPCIPDGVCVANENQHNCPDDCATCNTDGVCDVFENANCTDCCSTCVMPNDGTCTACEGADTCTPDGRCDCDPAICNYDGICDFYENDACADCTPRCVPNGKCEVNENAHVCPEDCGGCVTDGMCASGENASCPDCVQC